MDLRKKRIEIAVTSVILALSGYLQYVAYTTKVRTNVQGMKSMDFPKLMLYLMMLLCVCVIINSVRDYRRLKKEAEAQQAEKPKEPFIHKKVFISVALIILYTICWEILGFTLSSIIFVFIESRLLDDRKPWWHALVIAFVYTLILYCVFHFGFGVQFPEPIFDAILG